MKRLLMFIGLLSLVFSSESQVSQQNSFDLNVVLPASESHYYTASNYIRLLPDFHYRPENGNEAVMEIEPYLLFPPTYGSEIGGSNDSLANNYGIPQALPMNFDVNENGAAIINIPLEFPDGINGMSPDLSLIYNSQAGDGVMGLGWSIGGMSKISRVPYTYHYSDSCHAVTFSNNDELSLDGNKLIKGRDGNYYPEIFDYSVVKPISANSLQSGFKVLKPNGLVYEYGTTESSRYKIQNITMPIEWHLAKITDPFGNYIIFNYINDVNAGSFYPSSIQYTGNNNRSVSPMYEITFDYYNNDDRPDTQKKYFSQKQNNNYVSSYSKITKLLFYINCNYIQNGNSQRISFYELNYAQNGELPKKELVSIRKFGSSSESVNNGNIDDQTPNQLSGTVFGWKNSNATLQIDNSIQSLPTGKYYNNQNLWIQKTVFSARLSDKHASISDSDNEKKYESDIVHLMLLGENTTSTRYALNIYINDNYTTGSNSPNCRFYHADCEQVNANFSDGRNILALMPADTDGDGIDEIVCVSGYNSSADVSLIRYNKESYSCSGVNVLSNLQNPSALSDFRIADFNGDGLSDLFLVYENHPLIYISTESAPFSIRINNDNINFTNNREIVIGDFYGNKRDQILFMFKMNSQSFSRIFEVVNRNSQYVITTAVSVNSDFGDYRFGTNNHTKCDHLCYGDFNGDCKLDVLAMSSNNWYFYLSKGNGIFSEKMTYNDSSISDMVFSNYPPVVGDFNDDGFSDISVSFVTHEDFFEPPGQQNYFNTYKVLYRRDCLIRIDNNIRIIKKLVLDESGKEKYLDRVLHGDNLYYHRFNPFLYCVGNFKGTSPNEILYTRLTSSTNTNAHWLSLNFQNTGSFDNPHVQAISKIANGLGVVTRIKYIPNSYQGVWNPNRNDESVESPFIHTYLGYISVVKKTEEETQQNVYRTTNYRFTDALYHARGKGFLGFRQTWRNIEGESDYMHFVKVYKLNTEYNILFPKSSQKYYGHIKNITYIDSTHYEFITTTNFKALENNGFRVPNGVFYPYLTKEILYKFNSGHLYLYKKTEYNYLDDYGNLQNIEKRFGTSGTNYPYYETKNLTYDNYISSNRIIRGLLKTEETKSKLDSYGQEIVKTTDYTNEASTGFRLSKTTALGDDKEMIEQYSHDVFGNIVSITRRNDNDSRTESFTYSSNGRFLLGETNAENHTTTYSYINNKGLLRSVTDPNNLTTTYHYDFLDNVSQIDYPNGVVEKFVKKWTGTNYNMAPSDHPDLPGFGNPVYYSWNKKLGAEEYSVFYDQHDRKVREVTKTINGIKIYTDYTYYDKNCLLKKSSNPYYGSSGETPQFTTYNYDYLDRITRIELPDKSYQTHSYKGFVEEIRDFDGQSKKITKIASDLVHEVIDNPDSQSSKINYTYYGDGLLYKTVINDNNDTEISYTYDINGNPVSVNDPSLGLRTYNYNAFGEMLGSMNPDSVETFYTYDKIGRMLSRSDDDGESLWTYDDQLLGYLDVAAYIPSDNTEPRIKEEYFYDELGQTVRTTQTFNGQTPYTFCYSYNKFGKKKKITYPSGLSLSYNYDHDGFLNNVNNSSTGRILWDATGTDRWGNVDGFVLGETINVNYAYNPVTGLIENIDAQNDKPILKSRYSWSVTGNLESRNEMVLGYEESFNYDGFNRLTSVSMNGNETCSIDYDAVGNIVDRTDVGKMHYGDNGNPYSVNRIDSVVNHQCFMDNQQMTYTCFDKISHITQGGNALDIAYGVDRQRIWQRLSRNGVACKTKRYFTQLYETQTDSVGVVKNLHYLTSSSGLFAIFVTQSDNTETMYYTLKDHQGSLAAVVNQEDVKYYGYDAWGRRRDPYNFTYDSLSVDFDRGYTLHEHLDDFGLINMNGRLYDPIVGRMLSPDIVIQQDQYSQSYNRYSYCLNNPLRFTDPSGYVVRGKSLSFYDMSNKVLERYKIFGVSYDTEEAQGNQSPIFDENGEFLGTDDEGLQGEAIIMNQDDFWQGMSHENALKKGTLRSKMPIQTDPAILDKIDNQTASFPNRPDWDGYLTLDEANEWYRTGNGQPLYTDLSKVDLSGIYSLGEKYVGKEKVINLLTCNFSESSFVYGSVTLKRYPNHTVRAYNDNYEFKPHTPLWNPLNWPRNIEAAIGRKYAGQGQEYKIHLYGSAKLTPILPFIK